MFSQNAVGRRVAIIGAGPGGLSAAIAFVQAGCEVRLFERAPQVTPLGGAVLLSLPVLMVLRSYGVNIEGLGAFARTEFRNARGKLRARLPFNKKAEEKAGIPGWHYGMLRSAAVKRMMDVIPEGMIVPNHKLLRYEDRKDCVRLYFEDGQSYEADLLVGADGIRSTVAQQLFGDPKLFHCGIQVWLGWAHCDNMPEDVGYITHSSNVQASFFPINHEGRRAYEWWVVEPWNEGDQVKGTVPEHINRLLKGWCDPLPRLAAATDFNKNFFRWEIYNRLPLKRWSKGRVVCLGDAVHPVSPYAAYGMGMAIEDGFYLEKFLHGRNLSDLKALKAGFAQFEAQRVAYANHHTTFARKLGNMFHRTPWPMSALRDLIYDNTKLLEALIVKDYLKTAEDSVSDLGL